MVGRAEVPGRRTWRATCWRCLPLRTEIVTGFRSGGEQRGRIEVGEASCELVSLGLCEPLNKKGVEPTSIRSYEYHLSPLCILLINVELMSAVKTTCTMERQARLLQHAPMVPWRCAKASQSANDGVPLRIGESKVTKIRWPCFLPNLNLRLCLRLLQLVDLLPPCWSLC